MELQETTHITDKKIIHVTGEGKIHTNPQKSRHFVWSTIPTLFRGMRKDVL